MQLKTEGSGAASHGAEGGGALAEAGGQEMQAWEVWHRGRDGLTVPELKRGN